MKVKQLIRETKRLEQQVEQLNKQIAVNKSKLQELFDKKGLKSIVVEPTDETAGVTLTAIKVERLSIDYQVDKLKENLTPELFNEITLKHLVVVDISGFTKFMKQSGVKPADLKKYIETTIIVNKDAIKQLYEVGDISEKDLKGCYTAKITKSIQIKEKKGDSN